MAVGLLRARTLLIAACAVLSLGMLAFAQAAEAAPFVRSAHFTNTGAAFYSQFGNVIDISVGNSPLQTTVCVSGKCQAFDGGDIHVAGGVFGQFWAHGQSRQVRIYACSSACMSSVWVSQLTVP